MPTSTQSLVELLGLILIFAVVLVVCYFTTKFIAGRQVTQKRMGNFEVIETFPIAQNKYLQLIRVGNKYVVISVSKDSVTYITEVEESEVCKIQKSTVMSGKSFKEVLSGLSKNSSGTEEDIFPDGEQNNER
ncbi:MAG: flagellar biosynthetic protein FliO [Lachnospiraceae bacterium]|nr:flagellar biosynthetic protein FliO [Lachnospiraceae bacterium]